MPADLSIVSPGKASITGTPLVHLDFVLTGIVMTLLGPMLPILSARWSLNDAQAGNIFTAQFLSSMVGMLLSGVAVRHLGYRRTLICGLGGMSVGIATLAHANWITGMIAVCIFGVGFGLTTPAANLLIATTYPLRSAAALNLLNSSWGVGAMACPLLLAMAQRSGHTPQFLYATALALAILAVYFASVRFTADSMQSVAPAAEVSAANGANYWVAVIAALFLIYVGTETCVGGWIATYARRIDTGSRSFWAVTPSFFWGALLLGRVTAPVFLRRLRETALAQLGVALAVAGIVLLMATRMMPLIVIGTSLAGLGLASIYPINVSLLAHWFNDLSPRSTGFIFAAGTLGGAVLPWIVGVVSTHTGSVRLGFLVPLLGAITMLIFYITQRNLRPVRQASEANG